MVAAVESPSITADKAVDATVWNGDSEASLALALAPPTLDCVEAGVVKRWPPQDASCRRLGLTLTTETAFRLAVVKPFLDGVERRLQFSESLRVRIHTALHEALMNAIVHGNLGLDSRHRDSFEGLANLQDLIDSRLKTPQVARSAIAMEACWSEDALQVMVRDSGAGYTRPVPSQSNEHAGPRPRTSGRGLLLVDIFSDSVELLHGGTAISMGFRR